MLSKKVHGHDGLAVKDLLLYAVYFYAHVFAREGLGQMPSLLLILRQVFHFRTVLKHGHCPNSFAINLYRNSITHNTMIINIQLTIK